MDFRLPQDELTVRASRSGGPGGQHVNTSSTQVEVRWDIATSPSLTDDQRDRLLAVLAHRIRRGVLRVRSGARRSQHQNRAAAVDRMEALVTDALAVPPPRHATRPPRRAAEQRLRSKKERTEKKSRRKPPDWD